LKIEDIVAFLVVPKVRINHSGTKNKIGNTVFFMKRISFSDFKGYGTQGRILVTSFFF